MKTKEEILQYIKILAEQKTITKEELNLAYDGEVGFKEEEVLSKKSSIPEILYYIGGAVVFLGIAILIWENWDTLGFATKILSTLGSGVAAYLVGVLFNKEAKTEKVGIAFYLISALVIPMGLYIAFDNAGFDISSYGFEVLISGILLSMYLSSYVVFRKNIFTLFSIIFGTWLFFSLTNWMVGESLYFNDWRFYAYRLLAVGLAYMLIGYNFSKNKSTPLSKPLYAFGIFGFLGAAISLGGWKPEQNIFWVLIYPFLVFGTLFTSVYIKSKSFLTWGTFFLMAYILKITSEYFGDSLGWPLALVIAGLSMIGVGYMSISLKNKYLSGEKQLLINEKR